LLHEYISDAAIIKNTEKQDYFNTLLSQIFQVENISFVNQFHKHSLIKKRIIMMTKNKSNQLRKAKYLLLLPLLASMLIYTSCETNQIEEAEITSIKKTQTSYLELFSEIKINKGKKETYLDSYFGSNMPKGVEIEYEDLTKEEKNEYDIFLKKYNEIAKERTSISKLFKVKLFRDENNRGIITIITNIPFLKNKSTKILSETETETETNDVPFAIIENVPVFPGCDEGTRKEKGDCLNKKIRSFVIRDFNGDLSQTLGLSKGKKKIWVQFRIDEKGNVVDEKVIKSPHPKLSEEALRVVKTLPKMKPGKQRGKAVGMRYTLPISFNIE
jgi:TonB family protein